jgi:cytochrome c oxidase assembly protein subunit 15
MLKCALLAILFLPLALFSYLRYLVWENIFKLLLVFLFGGLQFVAHAYAVKNSIIDDPHFIPYLLSTQLALQFAFFGLILWQILSFSYPPQGIGGFELPKPTPGFKIIAVVTLIVIFLQVVLGGAVNGLHAGLSFNTFPLMDGTWIPEDLWPLKEWYRNLFEDAATAQFIHRVLAYVLFLIIMGFWIAGHNNPHIAHLLPILFSVFIVQFLLGVLTLLFTVPVPLSSLHQANALLVFGIAVTILHRLLIPIKSISYDIA